MTIEEHAAYIEGRVDSAVQMIAAMLAADDQRRVIIVKMVEGFASSTESLKQRGDPRQKAYATGIDATVDLFRKALERAGHAEQMRDLPTREPN